MWGWFKRPERVIDGEEFRPFVVADVKFRPKRTKIPGHRFKELRDREIAYNISDDVFQVGTGNGAYVEYVKLGRR